MPLENPLTFSRPGDGALYCLSRGFKIFPIKAGEKVPYAAGWQEWATTATEEKVRAFIKANSIFNWGIYCGASNLVVVDIDVKEGRAGQASLDALVKEHGPLPQTFKARTPSGGVHYFFTGTTKSMNGFRPGIDVKSTGGYVVAPGSRIDVNTYEIIDTSDPAPAPQWLLDAVEATKREVPVIDQAQGVITGERNAILTSLAGTMRRRGMNYEAILAALLAVNETQVHPSLPIDEVEHIAKSITRYAPEHAQAASDFLNVPKVMAKRAGQIDIAKIPPRDWVMRHRYIGGFVSMVVSPGGIGKSTFTLLDAASIVTGRPLSGFEVVKKGPVWCYNLEDPDDELQRRLAALSIQHGIPLPDLNDIHFTSGRTQPMIFVKEDPQAGLVINETAVGECVAYIKQHGIVLFMLDPMVRIHEVEENDNNKMAKVVNVLERIIAQTGAAVCLVHHFSKAGRNMAPGEISASRGATSPTDACRIAHTLSPMSTAEADKFGVPRRKASWYLRLDNAKANLQPPAESALWYERKGVILPNGDDVGTLVMGPGFKDVTDEKALAEEENQRTSLTNFMFGLMRPGDELSLKELYERFQMDPRYRGQIGEFSHQDTAKKKLMQLLTCDGILHRHVRFRYERKVSGKTKDVVVCERYEGGGPEDEKALNDALA